MKICEIKFIWKPTIEMLEPCGAGIMCTYLEYVENMWVSMEVVESYQPGAFLTRNIGLVLYKIVN